MNIINLSRIIYIISILIVLSLTNNISIHFAFFQYSGSKKWSNSGLRRKILYVLIMNKWVSHITTKYSLNLNLDYSKVFSVKFRICYWSRLGQPVAIWVFALLYILTFMG